MQNEYRKMYHENLLGTSDISIFKFYYASFKLQYSKGRITDVGSFLDECARISLDSNRLLKVFGIIPLFNLSFGTGKEQKRIAHIIKTKREDVEKMFLQESISDDDIKLLLSDLSPIVRNTRTKSKEEYLELVKMYILECYSQDKKKQLGDRVFGYFLKSRLIADNPEERQNLWKTFFGTQITPSDTRYFTDPSRNRSKNPKDFKTVMEHLTTIRDFYSEIGLEKVVHIIEKDMKKYQQ